MVHGCGHDPYRLRRSRSLSHPGARGGLDARLGASLDPRDDVSSRIHREEPQRTDVSPRTEPLRVRVGTQRSPGSMPGLR